jgi:hypothetical protein
MAPRRRRPRDNNDYLDMVRRIIHAAGHRVAEADADQLAQLVALRAELDEAILDAVRGLRDADITWQDIGTATGTTRQAAQLKWGPKL